MLPACGAHRELRGAQVVFVSLPPEAGLRARLTDYADARVEVRYEAESSRRVQELVAAGLGVALTVESEAYSPRAPRVGVHDLQDAPAQPPYGLIAPGGGLGSPLRALAGHLRRHRRAGTLVHSPESRPPR